jgi:hypothetical protein
MTFASSGTGQRRAERRSGALRHTAAHVVAVELFFRIALGAALIGTADANNRTDIGYLFYTPFCHVFVSSDNLHRRCAPHFLRTDQSFVWGHDLKADLNRLMNIYTGRPEEEKEQGLMRLAPTPPPNDQGVVARLWDDHFGAWRQRATEVPHSSDPKEGRRACCSYQSAL